MTYQVPPIEEHDADEAALSLLNGYVVDWEPGDCTRYSVALIRRHEHAWLAKLNGASFIVELPSHAADGDYWSSFLPKGTWAGLRPLLAALGAATPAGPYDAADARG